MYGYLRALTVAHVLAAVNEESCQIPPHKRKYGDEIIRGAQVSPAHIFDGSRLRQTEVLQAIKALQPDIGLSVLFGYILRPECLDLFPAGVVNLHPAYLPFNRGVYPNVWSIVEGTPSGVTSDVSPAASPATIVATTTGSPCST